MWDLLATVTRTPEDAERLLHAAHASCYHWLQAGSPLHHQRAAWLIAQVYAQLGEGDLALRFARRCMQLTEAHVEMMQDFDVAYAEEGMARAHAAHGEPVDALRYRKAAAEAGSRIADDED